MQINIKLQSIQVETWQISRILERIRWSISEDSYLICEIIKGFIFKQPLIIGNDQMGITHIDCRGPNTISLACPGELLGIRTVKDY